jgi:hypothetical protein
MNTEELRVHFINAAYNVETPNDIVEALKTLPTGAETQIADFIAEFCRAKRIE